MTDREELTALLMAGAGDCFGKVGALNCTKLADYLLEHGVIVLPYVRGDGHNFENSFDIFFLTREEAEKALKEREQNEGFKNNVNM